jgi:predicted phage terminase large subunit-like protein
MARRKAKTSRARPGSRRGEGCAREHHPLLTFTKRLFPGYQETRLHRYLGAKLTQFLLDVECEKSPRLMLCIPPRHGKSEIGSVHLPAWVLGERPDWPLMHVSYTADLSNAFSRRVRNLLKEDAYREMYPDVKLAPDSRSVAYWNLDAPHRGVFTSAGVGGPITGKGGKIVIIDDPVKNRQDADSEAFRQMQREWYGSTLYTRLEKGAGVLLIMTRWHTDDLGGYVTTGAGTDEVPTDAERWETVNLPAVCDSLSDPLGREIGETLWPEKYDALAMANIRGTLSNRDWMALYQQTPVAAEGNMLHVPRVKDHKGQVPKHLHVLQGWDLAISEKSTADYTVGVTIGLDPKTNDLYVLDLVRGRFDFNRTLAELDRAAQEWRPLVVAIEQVAYQAAALQEARRRFLHPLMGVKVTRDKVSRAMLLADKIDAGQVFAPKDAPWWRDLETEWLSFPSGSHDDTIDACGVALEAFSAMKSWRCA